MVLRKPVELRSSLRDSWNRISENSKTLANADFAGVFLNNNVLQIKMYPMLSRVCHTVNFSNIQKGSFMIK